MIVRDLDFIRVTFFPAKTDPVLIIDPDAVLISSVALQTFEPISRWYGQLGQIADLVDLSQLSARDRPKVHGTRSTGILAAYAVKHVFGALIGEGAYHGLHYNGRRIRQQGL